MQTLSSLNTWAAKIKNDYTSGFSLQALVNNLTGTTSNDVSASIIGIVQDGQSSLSLSADQINLDANDINLSDVIDIDINNGEVDSTFVLCRKSYQDVPDGGKLRILRADSDGVIQLRTELWPANSLAKQSINDLMTISGTWEAIQNNTHGIDVNLNGKLTARSLSLGNGNVNENILTAGNLTILGNGTVTATSFVKDANSTDILLANGNTLQQSRVVTMDSNGSALVNTIHATAFVKDSNSTNILLANGNTLAQSSFVSENSNGDINVGDIIAGDVNAGEVTVEGLTSTGDISLGGNITFGTSGTSSYKEGYTGTVVISGQQFTFKSGILVDVSPAGQQ
jgi:hypothetical protein